MFSEASVCSQGVGHVWFHIPSGWGIRVSGGIGVSRSRVSEVGYLAGMVSGVGYPGMGYQVGK